MGKNERRDHFFFGEEAKKLYRDIPCFQVILEESNCSLYALFRSLEKIKTNIYKSYKVQREPFEG